MEPLKKKKNFKKIFFKYFTWKNNFNYMDYSAIVFFPTKIPTF